ncbi:MAG: dihydroorotase family protein, partial [Candidatus Bathyarchaeia archaeon]
EVGRMLEADLNILGVRLLVGDELTEGGISIEDGRIVKIGKRPNLPRAGERLDAKGLVAIPGLIDCHVHLRDLELSYKEDFYTGTCAAAAGGFTTVLDMPNNQPPTNSAANLRLRRDMAAGKIVVNVGFHASLVGDEAEQRRMRALGAYSFKLYMNSPEAGVDVEVEAGLTDALSACGLMKVPVTIHAEDRGTIQARLAEYQGRPLGIEDYTYIHGPEAEVKAVRKALRAAAAAGAKIHLCHITLASSVEAVKEARAQGGAVSCEFTPHHLFLTRKVMEEYGGWALSDPPLRDNQNARTLLRELSTVPFAIVASDHARHTLPEKCSQDAREVKAGFPGLETALPMMLTQVSRGGLRLSKLVEVMAERPASIFNIRGKGMLSQGSDADIALLDLDREYKIDPERFHSKSRYSPFAGLKCKGGVSKVFVKGELVYEEGEVTAPPGTGSLLEAVSE